MVIKINFHAHSTGSDGKLTPEQVVQEAIKAKIDFLCFTDHYKDPHGFVDPNWPTAHFFSEEYIKQIRAIQVKYKQKIDISFGVELDWLADFESWTRAEVKKHAFDYVLGSVHILPLPLKAGHTSFDFGDGNDSKFLELVAKFGSLESMITTYYEQVRLLIRSGIYDGLGHFDYIKRYNTNQKLFSEDAPFYRQEVLKTLDELAKSGMCMEINMRGLMKSGKAHYPSLWILIEAQKRKIPLTIGTDAHTTGQVGDLLDEAYELARQAGYKEIVRFKDRKPIKINI